MAKTIEKNYTPHTVESGTWDTAPLKPTPIVWTNEFAVKAQSKGELTLVNVTSPINALETVRFAHKELQNVFANSGVDPAYYPSSKKGVSFLVQLNDIYTVTDDDLKTRTDFPISAHLVIRVPKADWITGDILQGIILRLLGAAHQVGPTVPTSMTKRLEALARGSLLPVQALGSDLRV